MKVTAIKSQVKRVGRYSIFIDDTYVLSLSEASLLDAHIASGQEIDRQQLTRLKRLSADDKIYNDTLNYVAIRPRSVWELETYLKRKGSPTLLIRKILNKLSNNGLLDDTDFARRWIDNRRLLKPTSLRKLALELRAKHVPPDVIDEVLGPHEGNDQDTIKELVVRKRKQGKYQDNLKLMQYLARQGFTYGDIKAVLEED